MFSKIDLVFLEDPNRMYMGKGKLSKRYKVSEEEVEISRKKVREILSSLELVNTLKNRADENQSPSDFIEFLLKNQSDFKSDILKRQLESKLRIEKDKYKKLLNSYEELNLLYDDALSLSDDRKFDLIPLIPSYKRQGASIAVLGDWHVEKRIEKHMTNGLNEFNPDVAKKRSIILANNLVKLINKDSAEFEKHTTVLYLVGDFIEGYIHPESQQIANYMTPIEAVSFALELLTNLISHIQNNANTDEIVVICKNGNHSRLTRRMESSVDYKMNYETILYSFLSQSFKNEIEFNLPTSDIGYTNILGKVIRDFHGWQVSYAGGVGGLTIPLNKFIVRQNQNIKADYNVLGHYHQCSMPTKDSLMTGAFCGYDVYAQTIGASFEPPMQAYRLLDSKYGFTSFNPIICE